MQTQEPVTIVIPVYNEGENIKKALDRLKSALEIPYQIHIVYDFEGDTTLPAAREYLSKNSLPVKLVHNNLGRGVVNALKKGLTNADTELTVVTMADLSDPPEVINVMVRKAQEEKLDVVCASRYMKGGKQVGGPWLKGVLSRLAGASLNTLTGIPTRDISNSFRLYRRSVLQRFPIESDGGFEVAMELTVKAYAAGLSVGEVPTTWEDRVAGESNFKLWKWMPKYMRWYLYSLKHRWLPRTLS